MQKTAQWGASYFLLLTKYQGESKTNSNNMWDSKNMSEHTPNIIIATLYTDRCNYDWAAGKCSKQLQSRHITCHLVVHHSETINCDSVFMVTEGENLQDSHKNVGKIWQKRQQPRRPRMYTTDDNVCNVQTPLPDTTNTLSLTTSTKSQRFCWGVHTALSTTSWITEKCVHAECNEPHRQS